LTDYLNRINYVGEYRGDRERLDLVRSRSIQPGLFALGLIMKYLAVAAIAIASMVMNTASAGFIPIDNFDGTPAGMQGDGLSGATTSVGRLFFTGAAGVSSFGYTGLNSINLGDFKTLRLTDVVFTVGNPTEVTARALVTGGVANSTVQTAYTAVSALTSGGNVLFDFSSIAGDQFDSVTSIQFQFLSADSFAFNAESLQAVPEPTTMALIGLVSAGGGVAGWRRRKVVAAV